MWLIYFRTTQTYHRLFGVQIKSGWRYMGSPNGRKIHKKFLKTAEEVSEFKLSLNGCGTLISFGGVSVCVLCLHKNVFSQNSSNSSMVDATRTTTTTTTRTTLAFLRERANAFQQSVTFFPPRPRRRRRKKEDNKEEEESIDSIARRDGKFDFLHVAERLFEEEEEEGKKKKQTREDYTRRWEYHAWHLFLALAVPVGLSASVVSHVRRHPHPNLLLRKENE